MSDQERIIELESRLTHLDDTVEQLNDIVCEQQKQISKLEHLLFKLAKEYSEIKEHLAPDVVDSRPPHY